MSMRFDSSTRLRAPSQSPAKGKSSDARLAGSSRLDKNDKDKMALQRALFSSSTPVFTFNQTIVLALFCSLVAVAATTGIMLLWPPPMPTSGYSRALLLPLQEQNNSTEYHHDDDDVFVALHDTSVPRFPMSVLPPPTINEHGPRPKIAWLLSFPNSGTSFTLHMTREASNCTTGTNYALEGDIKDKPSVQAIPGKIGENGPFLELISHRHTNIPDTLLTKTHCKAFCTGRLGCSDHQTFQTVRSFMIGCLAGTRAVDHHGLKKIHVVYDKSLVTKAIHIFRHPLDNIVARFHLDYQVQTDAGDLNFAQQFPRDAEGFHRWCEQDDSDKNILRSKFMDNTIRRLMQRIPCRNDFYRYVQWHNLAFSVSRDMNIPTMMLHYDEYTTDYEGTRDRVLDFLELPHAGEGEPFEAGKIYRHYYTNSQKIAIREFFQEVSSAETWEQLKEYFLAEDYVSTTVGGPTHDASEAVGGLTHDAMTT